MKNKLNVSKWLNLEINENQPLSPDLFVSQAIFRFLPFNPILKEETVSASYGKTDYMTKSQI